MDSQSVSRNGTSPVHTVGQLATMDLTLHAQGLDPDQVRTAFAALCAELEPIYVQMAELVRENDQLRRQARRSHATEASEEEHDYAIALLTQAQELADALISDASDQARDLVLAARAHQREIVKQTSVVAGPSPAQPAGSAGIDNEGAAVVHSLAKLAQTQFLAVIDALTEQVNRLGETAAGHTATGEAGVSETGSVKMAPRPAARQAS
jgi:cell division initiation protein